MSSHDDLVVINSAITQLMRRIARVDNQQGIGKARLSALAVLHFGGPCTMSELAESEMVSRPTMHHVVKGLESDGYVRRITDARDARRQIIRLTAKGTRTIERAHAARIQFLSEIAKDIDRAEIREAAKVLDQLRNNAWGLGV
ncbi:MAG: MarR family transcriptional regulator [Pseudomonadota bacterium]